MTITADIIAISSLKIGSAGTEYACTRFSRSVKVVGPNQTSAVAYRHEKWTATCHHVAADLASVAAAWETVRTTFCTRGDRVTHATWATGLRVLPESGTPSASEERSIAGYPIVEIAEVGEQSYGTWLTFTVQAETMVPVLDDGLAEHDYTITESENEDGLITLTQRGRVRVVNGGSARDWVEDEVIDAARTTAGTEGHEFSVRYTQGMDAAAIEYEYTAADRTTGGGGGVLANHVDDTSVKTEQGRIVRTVSGWAEGPGAVAFAEAQEPAASATLIKLRRSISAASIPEGRVNFSYEMLTGVTDARFPGIVIYRYDEDIEEVGGGREAMVQAYFDADPSIRMGVNAPYLYGQTTTIEFIGDWDDHGITPAFSTGLLARSPRTRRSGGQAGLRRVSISYAFISPTQITPLPAVLEIDAFA